MEYINRIVRLDHAINSVDCGEHPFKNGSFLIGGLNIAVSLTFAFFALWIGSIMGKLI